MAAKGLSREGILAAALDLADREGLEAVSMRRLGQALGVEAMSIYKHVANKDAILDGLLERVLSEVELPHSAGDWEAELRHAAVSLHEALARHPWACGLGADPDQDVVDRRPRQIPEQRGCMGRTEAQAG